MKVYSCIVCGREAEYIYKGSTYCHKHFIKASETDYRLMDLKKSKKEGRPFTEEEVDQ